MNFSLTAQDINHGRNNDPIKTEIFELDILGELIQE